MDKKRLILIALIGALMVGSSAISLAVSDRNAALYTSRNEMNYEMPQEEQIAEDVIEVPDVQDSNVSDRKSENAKETKPGEQAGERKSGEGDEGGAQTPERKLVSIQASWAGSHGLLYGIDPSISAISVRGHYSNGDEENIPIENCTLQGLDIKRLGSGTCTVLYYGLSASLNYTVNNWEKSIYVAGWDKADQYRYGDAFSKSDLSVRLVMADGSEKKLSTSSFNISGIDMKSVGSHAATVSYNGHSATAGYTVHNYPKSLASSIRKFAVRGDVKWKDIVKDETVIARMADGTKESLSPSDYTVSGFSTKENGSFTAAITYQGFTLEIPYHVEPAYIFITDRNNPNNTGKIAITRSTTIKSESQFNMQKEYRYGSQNKRYRLEGIYENPGYTKRFAGPVTYEVESEFRINRDGLEWQQYTLYAKYVPVNSDDPADPTKPTEPDDPAKPTEPDEPDDPAGPTKPTEPADASEPTSPAEQAEPARNDDPEEPDTQQESDHDSEPDSAESDQ
ncbi:MAG: bacterial Ig-like domain-containing protein [Firmicutes bacterium]|nr:bacterial Ig-like domain-containing protein [Bacillota bacterium]